MLIFNEMAFVERFTEYKNYYEINLEWKDPGLPEGYPKEDNWFQTKLIAFEKIRK